MKMRQNNDSGGKNMMKRKDECNGKGGEGNKEGR